MFSLTQWRHRYPIPFYTFTGFVVGLCFPLGAWLVDIATRQASWSIISIWRAHQLNPLHWIIDAAPLVLALFSREIGRRVQAETVLNRTARDAALLNDITHAALDTADLSAMLQTLADQVGTLLQADGSYITLWDEAHHRTIPAAAFGELRTVYPALTMLPDEPTLTASVLQAGHALAVDDVFNSPHISRRIAEQFPTRSLLGLPLISGGQKLGAVLIGFNQPHHFTPEEIALGESAAGKIALAVAKGRLLQEVSDERSRLQASIEASSSGIALISPDFRILIINHQMLALLRLPGQPADWVGRSLRDVAAGLRSHAPQVMRVMLAEASRIKQGDEPEGQGEYDIAPRSLAWQNRPVVAGTRSLGRLVILSDITARKQAEADLQQRLRQLQAIYQLSATVAQALAVTEIYTAALDALTTTLGADRAAILLFDSDGVARFEAWLGLSQAYRQAVEGHSPWPATETNAEPVLVPDVMTEPGLSQYRSAILEADIRALAFIPLTHQQRLLGKFMVYYTEPHLFTVDETQVAQTIASHVAFAIARKQAEANVRATLARTEALYHNSQALVLQKSLPDVLQMMADNVAATLAANRVALITLDVAQATITGYIKSGPGAENIAAVEFAELQQGLSGWAMREKKVAISPKGQPDERESLAVQQRRIATDCGTILVAPLLYQDQCLGTLTVINQIDQRDFAQPDVDLLLAMANQAALIIAHKQAEADLTRERDLLQALMDNFPDTIYFKDTASRFIRLNQAQARLLGLPAPEAAIGKTDADFQAADLARVFFEEEHQLFKTGRPIVDRLEYNPTPDGQPRWFSATKVPLRDPAGQIIGLVGISRDVTARQEVEQALEATNARLLELLAEQKQHSREMLLLNKLNELLQSCLDSAEAYRVIETSLPEVFPNASGWVGLVDASRNLLELAAHWGVAVPEAHVFSLEDCWALRRGRMHLAGTEGENVFCRHVAVSPPALTVCIPMLVQGKVFGILHLHQPQTSSTAMVFASARAPLAHTVADNIALALANLELRDTLRYQSIRDPLTGLFNRRYMEESLERELRRAARNHHPLSILMVDLDHFKRFNDTFGHDGGDALLRELSALLQTHIRGSDIASRYGGEEFTLILPEAGLEVAHQRAEHLREAIMHLDAYYNNQRFGPVTLSIGVATYPQHGHTGEQVLKAADLALYRAKHAGRNRVEVAD